MAKSPEKKAKTPKKAAKSPKKITKSLAAATEPEEFPLPAPPCDCCEALSGMIGALEESLNAGEAGMVYYKDGNWFVVKAPTAPGSDKLVGAGENSFYPRNP